MTVLAVLAITAAVGAAGYVAGRRAGIAEAERRRRDDERVRRALVRSGPGWRR